MGPYEPHRAWYSIFSTLRLLLPVFVLSTAVSCEGTMELGKVSVCTENCSP